MPDRERLICTVDRLNEVSTALGGLADIVVGTQDPVSGFADCPINVEGLHFLLAIVKERLQADIESLRSI